MLYKLNKYDYLLSREMSKLAKILDPRFGRDLLSENEILLRYVFLRNDNDRTYAASYAEESYSQACSGVNFMQSILEDDYLHEQYDEEFTSFLRVSYR